MTDQQIKQEALKILQEKLKIVKSCLEVKLKEFSQSAYTKEDEMALEQAIAYLKGESKGFELVNSYPIRVLKMFKFKYGDRLLLMPVGKNPAVRKMAMEVIERIDRAIEFLTARVC